MPLSVFGCPVVPVIVIDDAARARDVAEALAEGGIHCAEITLRTPAGLAAISTVAGVPDFVVGAGTVLTSAQVDEVVDAGARFVVSPGFDEEVVARAQELGIDVVPGVATASDIQRALRSGLTSLKLFPADRLGGLDAIHALSAPFGNVSFMPSGGVTAANAVEYLADPAVFAVSGSWMASRQMIAAGQFSLIRDLSTAISDRVPA